MWHEFCLFMTRWGKTTDIIDFATIWWTILDHSYMQYIWSVYSKLFHSIYYYWISNRFFLLRFIAVYTFFISYWITGYNIPIGIHIHVNDINQYWREKEIKLCNIFTFQSKTFVSDVILYIPWEREMNNKQKTNLAALELPFYFQIGPLAASIEKHFNVEHLKLSYCRCSSNINQIIIIKVCWTTDFFCCDLLIFDFNFWIENSML